MADKIQENQPPEPALGPLVAPKPTEGTGSSRPSDEIQQAARQHCGRIAINAAHREEIDPRQQFEPMIFIGGHTLLKSDAMDATRRRADPAQ